MFKVNTQNIFFANFENILHFFLVFVLLTLNK